MTAEHHDLVLGITSHLPHLIAYTIVGTADDLANVTRSEVLKFSAGGFRDFTRIAASDPTMWRDIFLYNKEAVLEMLGRFNEDLSLLTRAIRTGNGDALFDHFTRTRAIRRGIVEIGQDSPAPDFGRPHPALPETPLPRPYAADNEIKLNKAAAPHRAAIGPSDAMPSLKRSGIATARLPSSSVGRPRKARPTASAGPAFWRAMLPSPGASRSSAPKAEFIGLFAVGGSALSRPSAGRSFSRSATVSCSWPSSRPRRRKPELAAAPPRSSRPAAARALDDLDAAAGGLQLAKAHRPGLRRRSPSARAARSTLSASTGMRRRRMHAPARRRRSA